MMTTSQMLMCLRNFRPIAEDINAELERMHSPNEEHRWDNTWVAYGVSGKLCTDIIMLTNLLQRVEAEIRE